MQSNTHQQQKSKMTWAPNDSEYGVRWCQGVKSIFPSPHRLPLITSKMNLIRYMYTCMYIRWINLNYLRKKRLWPHVHSPKMIVIDRDTTAFWDDGVAVLNPRVDLDLWQLSPLHQLGSFNISEFHHVLFAFHICVIHEKFGYFSDYFILSLPN